MAAWIYACFGFFCSIKDDSRLIAFVGVFLRPWKLMPGVIVYKCCRPCFYNIDLGFKWKYCLLLQPVCRPDFYCCWGYSSISMFVQNLFGLLCFFFPSSATKNRSFCSTFRVGIILYTYKICQFTQFPQRANGWVQRSPPPQSNDFGLPFDLSCLLIFLWTLEMLSLPKVEMLHHH